MKGIIYALMFVFALGLVSATPSIVTGTIYSSGLSTVENATVTVMCNGNSLTDMTLSDGSYFVEFDTTQCNFLDDINVTAVIGNQTGFASGKMCSAQQCFIPVEIAGGGTDNVPSDVPVGIVDVTVPEFGVVAGALALIGAVGIIVYRRK